MKKLASELSLGDVLLVRGRSGSPVERIVDRVSDESPTHVRIVLYTEAGVRPSFTLPRRATVEVVQPTAA